MWPYRIPNYRRLLETARPWGNPESGIQPAPSNQSIHKLLKIPRGSKILFFAGAYGDWAHGLAQHSQVDYSDLAPGFIRYAKSRFEGKGIRQFLKADAVRWPQSNQYDYVASYQPWPIPTRIPLIILRALAHTKGIRIVDSPFEELDWLNAYEANARIEKVSFKRKIISRITRHDHDVLMVDSNPKARQRASLDLAIIHLLQGKKSHTVIDLINSLEKRGITATHQDVMSGLSRIETLSTHMAKYEGSKKSITDFIQIGEEPPKSVDEVKDYLKEYDGKIIAHIGPGRNYPGTPGGIEIDPKKELHLCFETEPERHENYLEKQSWEHRYSVLPVDPSEANGTQTGLASESVDQVHMHNVLTDSHDWKPYPEDSPQAHGLFQEAHRILKPGGKLIIGNTLDPRQFGLTGLKLLAKKYGFRVNVKIHDKTGTGMPNAAQLRKFGKTIGRKYGFPHDELRETSSGWSSNKFNHDFFYLVELTKQKPKTSRIKERQPRR